MTDATRPETVRCGSCGRPFNVPAAVHEDGQPSAMGRAAKCPSCGHVNPTDIPAVSKASTARKEQFIRRV